MAQPNWYIDPLDPSRGRYWDGARWSDEAQPIPPGQFLPTFPAEIAPAPPSPGWGAPAPTWGSPPVPATSYLPPSPPPLRPDAYIPYPAYQARRRGPNSTLVFTGVISLALGLLFIAWDVSDHLNPFSFAIGGLIALRGVFWIVRGLR